MALFQSLSLIVLFQLTQVLFLFSSYPLILSSVLYDDLIHKLEAEGAILRLKKNDTLKYRLPDRSWPFNRVRVKRTYSYLYVQGPVKWIKHIENDFKKTT